MTAPAPLVPLDPDACPDADADPARVAELIRRRLAEGCMHPARQRLLERLAAELERRAA